MRPDSMLFIAAAWLLTLTAVSSQQCRVKFYETNGFLCIRAGFIRTHSSIKTSVQCSVLCSSELDCQAFTMDDGPCQLFVFNKCSKSVRDCSCSRRGQVFVKQQPGLEPGALCPPGYGDDLCGVKYRVITDTGNWAVQRQRCESESGLVIMADVVDASEMAHVDLLFTKYPVEMFLGGFQAAGSAEPAGGWSWVGCNITLAGNSSLWGTGEPNDSEAGENTATRDGGRPHLSDRSDAETSFGALCECVSPF